MEAACSSIHFQVFSGFIMMYFAFYLKFGVLELTFTFAAVSLARIASFFGVWLAHRALNKKRMAFTFKICAVIVMGLLPFLADIQEFNTRFLLFLAIMTTQAVLYSIGGAIWCNWVRSGVPERQINRFFKDLSRISMTSSIITLFVVPFSLEKLPYITNNIPYLAALIMPDPLLFAFRTIFWLSTIVVLLGFLLQILITDPKDYQSSNPLTIKSILLTIIDKKYRLMLSFATVFMCAFCAISDLFFFHAIMYLNMSPISNSILAIIGITVVSVLSNGWRKLANRFGMKTVMLLVILPAGFLVLMSTFLATKESPWFIIGVIIGLGICVSAINVFVIELPVKLARPEEKSIVAAGFRVFISIGATIGILFSGLTMHFFGKTQLPTLLGIQVVPFHSVALVIFILYIVSFVILRKIVEPGAAKLIEMLPHVIPVLFGLDKSDHK